MTSSQHRTPWRKSSYSTTQENCVEIAHGDDTIAIRDSKDPHGPTLHLTATSFARFVRAL